MTSYGIPTLSAVTYPSSSIVPLGANGVRTDGNVTLTLTGTNFGPVSPSFVQYVRILSSFGETSATSFSLVSDGVLSVTVPPGVGKNLSFVVGIGSQSSPVAPVSYDYLGPVVLSLSPSVGPTLPAGTLISVTGLNFGQSAGASVVVVFGNPADGTQSGWLPTQPVYPPGDNGQPKVRPNETIQFFLPPGVGTGRAVQVLVYPASHTSLTVASDPGKRVERVCVLARAFS